MRIALAALVALAVLTAGAWWSLRSAPIPKAESAPLPSPPMEVAPPMAPDLALPEAEPDRAAVPATVESSPAPAVASPPARRVGLVLGRCVDSEQRALAGVEILEQGSRSVLGRTDATGRFRIEVGLHTNRESHSAVLITRCQGYARAQVRAVLSSTAPEDVGEIVLSPGGALSGSVVDASGAPLAGARIACTEVEPIDPNFARRHFPYNSLAESESDAFGSFRVDGLPTGSVRVWATKDGFRNGYSEPVEVRAGEEVFDLELRLEAERAEDFIEILVLDPGGAPVPRAEVDYSYQTGRGSGSGSTSTGKDGRVRLEVNVNAPYELRAADREGRYAGAVAKGVLPGSGEVVLRLSEPSQVELTVTDSTGRPVETYEIRFVDPERRYQSVSSRALPREHPLGREILNAPVVAFILQIDAQACELLELGPYDSSSTPKSISAVLRPLPGLHGLVSAGGKPVRGAKVTLREALPAGERGYLDGFPSRVGFDDLAEERSDEEGRFHLFPREGGPAYLRAELAGYAPAELGPLEIDTSREQSGLVLELTRGGAIEGRVHLPPGQDPRGTVVAASRADGHPRSLRAGEDGSFRFELLTPGRWLVKRLDALPDPDSHSFSGGMSGRAAEIPWSCEVRDGETTRFDLDLSVDHRPRLEGRLLLGGKAPAGWQAQLISEETSLGESSGGDLDPDGRFVVFGEQPGEHRLFLSGEGGAASRIFLNAELVLAEGANAWELDLPVGRVEVRRASAPPPGGPVSFLRWNGADGLGCAMQIETDAREFTLDPVPAGACSIERWDGQAHSVLARFEVRSGETALVALP